MQFRAKFQQCSNSSNRHCSKFYSIASIGALRNLADEQRAELPVLRIQRQCSTRIVACESTHTMALTIVPVNLWPYESYTVADAS